jgi:hypothetical protein
MKTCNCCGRRYSWLRWCCLPYLGTMQLDESDPVVELRNCRCGSTLGLEYDPPAPWWLGVDRFDFAAGALVVLASLACSIWMSL